MSNVLNKVKTIFGFGDDEDNLDDIYDDELEIDGKENDEMEDGIEPVISSKKNNKVVNIHTSSATKVNVVKPTSFDDATEICDALKNRRIVVINTSALENRIAQRLLDFISGSCYALGGALQEVEKSVYLLSPSNVEVSNEFKSEIASKALFSFSK